MPTSSSTAASRTGLDLDPQVAEHPHQGVGDGLGAAGGGQPTRCSAAISVDATADVPR